MTLGIIFAGQGRTLPLECRFIEMFIRDMNVLALATVGNATQIGLSLLVLCHLRL
jgi:hypothetical protein